MSLSFTWMVVVYGVTRVRARRNSFHTWMNTRIAVDAYPGSATTDTIRKKICSREAPST